MARDKASNALIEQCAWAAEEFYYDPSGYIDWNWPWLTAGTQLEKYDGPDRWQREVNEYIGQNLAVSDVATRVAVASGHGIGKSAEVSWLIKWFMATRPNPGILVTANTKNQLQGRLWRELALWHNRGMDAPLYEWTATMYRLRDQPETWVANAVPWSENNPEAFAGLHAEDVLIVFDEASAIASCIWEVVEGALSTPGSVIVAFGNPTRSSGRFFDCFHSFRDMWWVKNVDSRTAKMTNKAQIKQWEETYGGDDSDFFRVRVKGQFPRVGSTQLIGTPLVERAMGNSYAMVPEGATKALGADIARFGDDETVVCIREQSVVRPLIGWRGLDTMATAARIARIIDVENPDTVFVDGVGLGAGVVDRLRQLNYDVVDVQAGGSPDEPELYQYKRDEMWVKMEQWLHGDVALPADPDLKGQLIQQEYGYNGRGKLQLVTKDQMKKDGLPSPDRADSVALTFAEPIRPARLRGPNRFNRDADGGRIITPGSRGWMVM